MSLRGFGVADSEEEDTGDGIELFDEFSDDDDEEGLGCRKVTLAELRRVFSARVMNGWMLWP